MENKIIGFFEDEGKFVAGVLVKEDETHYYLDKSIILLIRGQGVTAKPAELINEEPDVSIRQVGVLANPNDPIPFKYKKSDIRTDPLELSDNFLESYRKIISPPATGEIAPTSSKNDTEQVVELY